MDYLFPFHNNYYSLVMLSDVFTVYKCTAELFCWHLFHFDRCWTLIGAEMPYSSSAQLISVHHQQSRLLCKSEAYSHSDLLARITFRPKHQTFFAIPRRSISVCRLWHGGPRIRHKYLLVDEDRAEKCTAHVRDITCLPSVAACWAARGMHLCDVKMTW